jgi:hypothetical protein
MSATLGLRQRDHPGQTAYATDNTETGVGALQVTAGLFQPSPFPAHRKHSMPH